MPRKAAVKSGPTARKFEHGTAQPPGVLWVLTGQGTRYEYHRQGNRWHRADEVQVPGHRIPDCPGVTWDFLTGYCGTVTEDIR